MAQKEEKQEEEGHRRLEMVSGATSGWMMGFTIGWVAHLDGAGGSPHAEEVLPLQDGPEAALQRHYPPQHLLMEEGLETVALRLPQEHLRDEQTTKKKNI